MMRKENENMNDEKRESRVGRVGKDECSVAAQISGNSYNEI